MKSSTKNSLIKNKKFIALFITQFCGALNDNVFKNALIILITYKEATVFGLEAKSIVALSGGIFILPFFLFSSLSGQLADSFQRAKLARFVKWMELFIMLICSAGFIFHIFPLLLLGLFLMGLHSTLFGPIKYSIIPDLIYNGEIENQISNDHTSQRKHENIKLLNSANAYVEAGTFIAILFGTILGGWAASLRNQEWIIDSLLILVSLTGLVSSFFIPDVPIADRNLSIRFNLIRDTSNLLKQAKKNIIVFHNILSLSWFWFLGAIVLSILPTLTKDVISGSEQVVTFFLAAFTIGIAIGTGLSSFLMKWLKNKHIVIVGSLLMTLSLVDWAWVISHWAPLSLAAKETFSLAHFMQLDSAWRLVFDLLAVAVGGGLFTVPQTTSMQIHSTLGELSRTIAANNIMNAVYMVVGSVFLMICYQQGIVIYQILLALGALNILALLISIKKFPA